MFYFLHVPSLSSAFWAWALWIYFSQSFRNGISQLSFLKRFCDCGYGENLENVTWVQQKDSYTRSQMKIIKAIFKKYIYFEIFWMLIFGNKKSVLLLLGNYEFLAELYLQTPGVNLFGREKTSFDPLILKVSTLKTLFKKVTCLYVLTQKTWLMSENKSKARKPFHLLIIRNRVLFSLSSNSYFFISL